jgi:hypothetical protein
MMSKWCQEPELDENAKVGLSFIAVGYGVVLVAVFPAEAATLAHTGIAGLFHLGLAAFTLVISWMGYYTNRARYPVWRVQFFNIPLWQYILSFGILFAYWELGITVEKPGSHAVPTPRSEAFIMVIVFIAYLLWDFLEVRIQESERYVRKLLHDNASYLPPLSVRYATKFHKRRSIGQRRRTGSPWFAKDVRSCRFIICVFAIGYGITLVIVIFGHLKGTESVVIVDSAYIVSLLLTVSCNGNGRCGGILNCFLSAYRGRMRASRSSRSHVRRGASCRPDP